ncbi:MAG: DnaJ domain-containing protein [Armatimonadota bacterium]
MAPKRDHYQVLGVPRNATPEQIKAKYKQMARKFHPDIAEDKEVAHRIFLQVNEAYEVLIDPEKRKAYDATLRLEGIANAGVNKTQSAQPQPPPRPVNVPKELRDAELAFIQRRLEEAERHCRAVLRTDSKNARAYAILGDIYRVQNKEDQAIHNYSYALQLNPNDTDSERKLNKLVGRSSRVSSVSANSVKMDSRVLLMNLVWATIAIFLLFLINLSKGNAIGGTIPFLSNFSPNLIAFISGAGLVTGLLLAINNVFDNARDEIVFDSSGTRWQPIPSGILILLGSIIFFPIVVALYFIFGAIQNSISRSIMLAFLATGLILVISMIMYQEHGSSVLILGGNFVFPAMVAGWFLGSPKIAGDLK